jgi:hypothetical protein
MTPQSLVEAFATAVAHEEGFYVAGSVPQRANNPCDLTDDGDVGCGVIHTSGPEGAGITIYPNVEAGWQAAYKKFGRMLNGASHVYTLDMTISDVGMKYSGNATWGVNVAARLGVPPTMTLAEYIAQGLGTNHDNVQQATEEA